jgi:hypothetical protein
MELGETIALLVAQEFEEGDCPFCASDAERQDDEPPVELVNNSTTLGINSGPKPTTKMFHPIAKNDYEIFEDCSPTQKMSRITPNAHHVIPGNESLARAPELMRWLAGNVSIKKEETGKTKLKKVKKIVRKLPESLSPDERIKKWNSIVSEVLPRRTIVESENGVNVWCARESTKGTLKIDKYSKPVKDKHVFGKVKFDINERINNIWLPSSNAVSDWSKVKKKKAWHMHQDPEKDSPISFAEAYAYNAMEAYGVQFHDRHKDYSDAVRQQLLKIDIKLSDLAKACHSHDDSSSKEGEPYPAPKRLRHALVTLADLIRDLLDINITEPMHPWLTSKLSLKIAENYWQNH